MIGVVGLLLCLILMMMYLLCQRSKEGVMVIGSNLEMQNYHDTIDNREDPILGNIIQTRPYERERKREPTPRRDGGREVPARLGCLSFSCLDETQRSDFQIPHLRRGYKRFHKQKRIGVLCDHNFITILKP